MENIIKANLIKLTELEEIANNAEKAYEMDPESDELENAFDEAYKAQYETFTFLLEQLEQFTGLNKGTAKRLISEKRNEILNILA